MMMLPEPTEVMPTRNPATRPITAMPAKLFVVGGRFTTRSSILLWNSSSVGITISSTPTAVLMKLLTPSP